ncbi:hypothetical protein OK349_16165 [Sphingomonas sp. BT-65]|uniref:hypothetical protein n=1 Tax=Sphingomonas sp. BT-65 TaxID=2989821 RepID=UPI002236156D|nr:hypothetical protein [Sphingomonas sp. BT-65]MCW4463249.1 hypothetical protein [Sphingomonas sp. BT-65]
MTRHIALTAALNAAALVASPVWACSIAPPPPPLVGESPEAYKVRVAELDRRQTETWLRTRQTTALQHAALIFVARDTAWTPPYRPPPTRRVRAGQPIPPPVPLPKVRYAYPAPSYFKPIGWFRGPRPQALFRVNRSMTTCGAMSIGDTTHSAPGNLYVFFARKGPLSEKTLIDAIAVDSIDDPALVAFVAKYRGKPPAARR